MNVDETIWAVRNDGTIYSVEIPTQPLSGRGAGYIILQFNESSNDTTYFVAEECARAFLADLIKEEEE